MKRSFPTCRPTHARRGGFTLVELLVVIGIIALLISILLPSLNRARQSAKNVVCLSNLRSIGQAIMLYANDQKGTLPYGQWNGSSPLNETGPYGPKAGDWPILLRSAALGGAGGTNYTESSEAGSPGSRLSDSFSCPEVAVLGVPGQEVTHYSAHPRLMPHLEMPDLYAGAPGNGTTGPFLKPYKVSRVQDNARKILIFDGVVYDDPNSPEVGSTANPVGERLDAYRIRYDGDAKLFLVSNWDKAGLPNYIYEGASIDLSVFPPDSVPVNSDTPQNSGNIRFRHNGDTKANAVNVDGHAESYSFKDKYEGQLQRDNVYVNQ